MPCDRSLQRQGDQYAVRGDITVIDAGVVEELEASCGVYCKFCTANEIQWRNRGYDISQRSLDVLHRNEPSMSGDNIENIDRVVTKDNETHTNTENTHVRLNPVPNICTTNGLFERF